MSFRRFLEIAIFLFITVPAQAAPHVALMNFSTDDNSYRSAQSAADFTSLLQIQLADAPEVEWVERAQLELAKKELGLSEMDLIGGAVPMRWGKWAKADWLVTGQFSLDDKSQRTLFVEITDLQHADVLASRTITFTDPSTCHNSKLSPTKLKLPTGRCASFYLRARVRQQQTAGKVLVAPLFLAATDESEMVLDGLVEANRNAWQQAADLYVWNLRVKRKTTPGKPPETKLEIGFASVGWSFTADCHKRRDAV